MHACKDAVLKHSLKQYYYLPCQWGTFLTRFTWNGTFIEREVSWVGLFTVLFEIFCKYLLDIYRDEKVLD